jgi:hypothetical protein
MPPNQQMCQLTLAASAANAFPVFLDFCYSSEGKLDAETVCEGVVGPAERRM